VRELGENIVRMSDNVREWARILRNLREHKGIPAERMRGAPGFLTLRQSRITNGGGYSRLHSEQAQKSRITYGGYSKPREGKPNRDRSLDWAFRGLPLSKSNCFQQTKLVCGIGRGGGGTLRIFITGRAARASPAQLTAATFSLKSVIPGQASLPEPAPDPGN